MQAKVCYGSVDASPRAVSTEDLAIMQIEPWRRYPSSSPLQPVGNAHSGLRGRRSPYRGGHAVQTTRASSVPSRPALFSTNCSDRPAGVLSGMILGAIRQIPEFLRAICPDRCHAG